jgi:hypothetical protein
MLLMELTQLHLTITDNAGCANTYSHPVVINAPITLVPTLVQVHFVMEEQMEVLL